MKGAETRISQHGPDASMTEIRKRQDVTGALEVS